MGNFLILILLLAILGYLVKHVGGKGEQSNNGVVQISNTDLLTLLLQLTKVSEQLETLNLDTENVKVRQSKDLVDAVRKRLVGLLRGAGVSELAIQQASTTR